MHYQTMLATQHLLATWPWLLAVATAGVILYVDWIGECYYIETRLGYSPDMLHVALRKARALGLEPIPEDECPAEVQPDGTVRIYLAQIRALVPA